MGNKKHIQAVAGLFILLASLSLPAAKTNTATIGKLTIAGAKQCLKYNIKGVCLWLVCYGPYCRVKTSPRITHYLPDVVVSAYQHDGQNPWVEMSMLGKSSITKGGQVTHMGDGRKQQENLYYKAVDIIGNPVISTKHFTRKFMCRSQAVSFRPYFLSHLDKFSWINGWMERLYPMSWIPGLREIGRFPLNTWGSVYPRTGITTHPEEPKTAAIVAQRAGDIVTRKWQPHVYYPLHGCRGRGCRPPPPLRENDPRSGTWQMLTPKPELSCKTFGKNDALSLKGWSDFRGSTKHQYAWNLWRKYVCCIPRKGMYIGHAP